MSDPLAGVRDGLLREADRRSAAAAGRLSDAAVGEGLLDVAYVREDSPVGPLLLAATEAGLVRLAFLASDTEEGVLARLADTVSPRLLQSSGRLDPVRRQLDEYFGGRRRRFDVALDRRLATGFNRSVLDVLEALEYGETCSYADIARRAGRPRAHRAAGNALNRNPLPVIVPCHRVLRTGGALGGYGGGLATKEHLLRLEGVL